MNLRALVLPAVVVAGGLIAWQVLASPRRPPKKLVGPYYVKESVQLPAPILPRIRALAEAYLAATGQRFTITDGTRRPEDQAALMIRNLERGDDLGIYANKAAAAAVRDAWLAGKAKDWSDAQVAASVTDVIRQQIAGGVYVSKHLREGAVDVRSYDMTAPMRATFLQLCKQHGVAVIDETGTSTPHYHLNF